MEITHKRLKRNKIVTFCLDEFSPLKDLCFLRFVNFTNVSIVYVTFIIGTLSNMLLLFAYLTRRNKFVEKYYLPIYCAANQLAMLSFTGSNIPFGNLNEQSLVDYSPLACKLFTFTFHIASTQVNIIYATYPLLLRLYIVKSAKGLRMVRLILMLLPLLFGIVYSTDLIYFDLVKKQSEVTLNGTGLLLPKMPKTHCGIDNLHLNLTVDLVDVLFYLILPVIVMVVSMCLVKSDEPDFRKLQIIIPIILASVWSPVCVLTLFRYYQIVYRKNSFDVEILFTLALVLNYCLPVIGCCIHAITNEHTRMVFFRLSCFVCNTFQRKSVETQSELQPTLNNVSPNAEIDLIRKTFYKNYFKDCPTTKL